MIGGSPVGRIVTILFPIRCRKPLFKPRRRNGIVIIGHFSALRLPKKIKGLVHPAY